MDGFSERCFVVLQTSATRARGTPDTGDMIRDLTIWFGVIVVVMVLALVFLKRAKKLVVSDSRPPKEFTFDLDQLRDLRDRGEITIQEYETLRKTAIEKSLARPSAGSRAGHVLSKRRGEPPPSASTP